MIPEATAALVAVFDPLTTTYDALAPADVWPDEFVVVGGSERITDEADGATWRTEWRGLGAKSRTTTAEIPCVIVCQNGDIADLRARAYDLLAQLTSAIVADPTLGGVVSSGHFLPVEGSHQVASTEAGVYVRIPFTITATTR